MNLDRLARMEVPEITAAVVEAMEPKPARAVCGMFLKLHFVVTVHDGGAVKLSLSPASGRLRLSEVRAFLRLAQVDQDRLGVPVPILNGRGLLWQIEPQRLHS